MNASLHSRVNSRKLSSGCTHPAAYLRQIPTRVINSAHNPMHQSWNYSYFLSHLVTKRQYHKQWYTLFRHQPTHGSVPVLMRTLMIMLTLSWGCCVLSGAQLLSPPWRHIDPDDVTPQPQPRAGHQWPIRGQIPEWLTNQESGPWLSAPQLWPGHHNLGLEFYKYRTNKSLLYLELYLE